MAQLEDRIENNQWKITLDGLEDIFCQEVTLPTQERGFEELGQGGGLPDVKVFFEKTKVGEMSVKHLIAKGDAVQAWFDNPEKKDGTVELMKNGSAVFTYEIEGVWISQNNIGQLTKTGDGEALARELTFQVDTIKEV